MCEHGHECACEPAAMPWSLAWTEADDAVDPVAAQQAADPDAFWFFDERHEAAVAAQMVADAFSTPAERKVA